MHFRILLILLISLKSSHGHAKLFLSTFGYSNLSFLELTKEVERRNSLDLKSNVLSYNSLESISFKQPWLFVNGHKNLLNKVGNLSPYFWRWLNAGGFAVVYSPIDQANLVAWFEVYQSPLAQIKLQILTTDSEFAKSFYLLNNLPTCQEKHWYGVFIRSRLVMVISPIDIVSHASDQNISPKCESEVSRETSIRMFINSMMIALTTDYKNDQIHLPEILKRIR